MWAYPTNINLLLTSFLISSNAFWAPSESYCFTKSLYSSSNFVSLRFDGKVNVGIEGVEEGFDEIIYDGEIVKAPQEGISVYSTDGRLILATEESILEVSSLSNGVYIVKSGSLTTKIVK